MGGIGSDSVGAAKVRVGEGNAGCLIAWAFCECVFVSFCSFTLLRLLHNWPGLALSHLQPGMELVPSLCHSHWSRPLMYPDALCTATQFTAAH